MTKNREKLECLTLSAEQAAEILGTSRIAVYGFMKQPGFPCIKQGRNNRIPRDALIRWMNEQTAND